MIAPILASLSRHRATTTLLALQVALTCAVVCNATAMLVDRLAIMSPVTGLAEDRLVVIADVATHVDHLVARHQDDLARLRTIPGVVAVTAMESLPLSHSSFGMGIRSTPPGPDAGAEVVASVYAGSAGTLRTLGLELVAGRTFNTADFIPASASAGESDFLKLHAAVVTRALAHRLWGDATPEQSIVGRKLYRDGHPVEVVGVIDRLLVPEPGTEADENLSMLLPIQPGGNWTMFVLNTAPELRGRVLKDAVDALNASDPERIVRSADTYEGMRGEYFRRDRTMVGLLIASALGLLFVTGLGVAGLASFWVQQRIRQIGIRRAIGATRGQIRRHFHLENGIIVAAGCAAGTLMALGLNLWLMQRYELPRLPLGYLGLGMATLLVVGQMAVYGAARRASTITPVAAIRSA